MRNHIAFVTMLCAFCVYPVAAQEVLTLTTPEDQGAPNRITWNVKEIHFLFEAGVGEDENRIITRLVDNNGTSITCQWTGATAHTDMVALNKANLTGNSLERRTILRTQAVGGQDPDATDGGPCLPAGAVTGTPQ